MKNKSIYHWLIVAACSGLAMAAIGISINCAGIFFSSVSESLGVGRGAVSMTITLTNVITGLMGPFVASRLIGKVNIKLLTGAGAVVTDNVPDHALMLGVPARRCGWACECGELLKDGLRCPKCGRKYREGENGLTEVKD